MQGNVIFGDVVLENVRDSYIHSDAGLVTASGVDRMVIVATKDATFISSKDNVDATRSVVDILKQAERGELNTHKGQFRPWGYYEILGSGPGFQVKHLSLKPGAKISLQKLYLRADHWIVLSGTAHVSCNGEEFELEENESTFIPRGVVHRLENTGSRPISIVEVQTGGELREDDIERFEDAYRRT